MKKSIILILLIILLSGCSKDNKELNIIYYNLNIDKLYYENIEINLNKNAYDIAEQKIMEDIAIPIEYIMLYDNINPIYSNLTTTYKRKIKTYSDRINVRLNYNYIENDFINSNFINNCFENHSIISTTNYIDIELSGKFYCLYDKIVNINIFSNYKVESSNGNLNDNVYNWEINSENENDVLIKYKLLRNYSLIYDNYENTNSNNITINIIKLILLLVVLIVSIILYKKYSNNNSERL